MFGCITECCQWRTDGAPAEDGRTICLGKETVSFPSGVVGQRIDEKVGEMERSFASSSGSSPSSSASPSSGSKPFVRDLAQDRGVLQQLDAALRLIADFPKQEDGTWNMPSLFVGLKPTVEELKKASVDLYLCRAVVTVDEVIENRPSKREVMHKWIALVDREAAPPDYVPKHAYVPQQQEEEPADRKKCSVM